MAKKKKAPRAPPRVYEFTISLEDTSPLVWRRCLAHEIINLDELHMLIQMTMGWEAKHLYEFEIGDQIYTSPENADESHSENAEDFLLQDVLEDHREFTYAYDFGDGWQHKVKITNIFEHDTRLKYPLCTGGENACPPEDCGGPGGFEDLKKILSGKDCDEKSELMNWVGGFFNPTTFDPNFVNRFLLWADIDPESEDLDS